MGRIIDNFECVEGAAPITDYSDLIPTWVHNISDLNRVEAENILHAQKKYLQGNIADPKKWFHPTDLKAIHQAMFHQVWR